MLKKSLIYIFLFAGALMFIYPFYWMIMASVVPSNEIGDLTFLPSRLYPGELHAIAGKNSDRTSLLK